MMAKIGEWLFWFGAALLLVYLWSTAMNALRLLNHWIQKKIEEVEHGKSDMRSGRDAD